jgi:1-deoxy-D-xylulose-5-phosphate reductoisomerase
MSRTQQLDVPQVSPCTVRQVVVLGCTGSIGRSTLDVIAGSGGKLAAYALSAHSRLEDAARQARQFRPRYLIATCPDTAARFSTEWLPEQTELLVGQEALAAIVADPAVALVVAGIVGSAGLASAVAALAAGKTLALANKETLVMAGPLVTQLAQRTGAKLLPVDSEHSAVFQAMTAGGRTEVARVLLTASGGPFLRATPAELAAVTVQQALAHPTWHMGPKISVDSATMMNKALEIIEARWLFQLAPAQIQVVIHPQSIVHSLVEFQDGSVVAQLGPPDMRLPIQYALSYPDRWPSANQRLDWNQAMRLDFEPPDPVRFPALRLGYEVAEAGGTAGAVLNAANEAAVAEFLAHRLPFNQIVPVCEAVLRHHSFDHNPTLDDLLLVDRWARQEVLRWMARC